MRHLVLWLTAALLIVTVLIPALIVGNWTVGVPESIQVPGAVETDLQVALYDNASGILRQLPLEDYLVGVVAGEMPASFHLEALKAQAIVARTYTVSKMKIFGGRGCPDHPKADVCSDPATSQAWISATEMRLRWGALHYYFNRRRIERAVQQTKGLIVTFGGQPIDAVYHSTSGGRTEDAVAVWGEAMPYLRSVPSPNEESSPKFASTVTYSNSKLASILGISAADLRGGIDITSRTPGGRVGEVSIGAHTWSGRDFRELLNLPSTWFETTVSGGTVTFQVRGYGHGVGMSQFGADAMARQGKTFDEIIKYYYQGVEIHPIFAE